MIHFFPFPCRLLTLLFYSDFFFIAKTFGTDLKPVARFYFVAARKKMRFVVSRIDNWRGHA